MDKSKKIIIKRKTDHIRINLEHDVSSGITNGLEHFRFIHRALPELDYKKIDASTLFLQKKLSFPFLISSMTGGTKEAERINIHLANAAEECKIGFALGSMRAVLENSQSAKSFEIRKYIPNGLVLANIGAVQLNYGIGISECKKIIDLVQADGLILHLNPLQEVLQPEGNSDFSKLLGKIEHICKLLPIPVIVKEVGWGISNEVARQLIKTGISAIDVAGAGGTSWSQVEMYRTQDPVLVETARVFKDWGISTADSISQVRRTDKAIGLIASGGINNGIEAAKCIALGANLVGFARPFLKAGITSTEEVLVVTDILSKQFLTAMFAVGAKQISDLARTKLQKI